MTIDDLDDMIGRVSGAAMVLLTGPDWQATMRERPLIRSCGLDADHVVDRGLPVWMTTPGPSRLLSADQVHAERLDEV